jgi:hypothetical protein
MSSGTRHWGYAAKLESVTTKPLTEMSTRNLPGGKARPERKADNITAISEPNV